MSDLDNLADVWDGLSAALVRLKRVAADAADAAESPALVDTDAVADVLELAYEVQEMGQVVFDHLRRVGLVKARNMPDGRLVSSGGTAGWVAVRGSGRWMPDVLHRMTSTELKEVRP